MAYVPIPPIHSDGSNSSSSSSDVPASWIIAYVIIALIVWIATATAATLYQSDKPNGEDIAMGVVLGAFLALIWPITAAGAVVWLLVRHLTRPRTNPEDTA